MQMDTLGADGRKALETVMLCYQCGSCTASCPLNILNGTVINPRMVMRSLQLGLRTNVDPYLCSMCMACEASCPRGVRILDVMRWMRVEAYQANRAPQRLVQVLWNVYEEGNPWGYPAKERGKWAEGLKLDHVRDRAKTLLYVGCISSYDVRLQRVARAVVELLSRAAIDFTILKDGEKCCGDSVMNVGEVGFLEELVQDNIRTFKEKGVETIITISPHCYQMMKNTYPSYGGEFHVMHYTEYLARLLDEGKLSIDARYEGTITYHDPCYLARYSGIFEEPRKLLEHVKGCELEEMRMSKSLTLCCGGGGGRIFMETEPAKRPANVRVRQAVETGAKVIATSCPYCIINFEDSIRLQKIELKVMDVAEILTAGSR